MQFVNSGPHTGLETVLGDNVLVGPNALVDQATIESFAFVGMGATVGHGSKIESYGVLAAGANLGKD